MSEGNEGKSSIKRAYLSIRVGLLFIIVAIVELVVVDGSFGPARGHLSEGTGGKRAGDRIRSFEGNSYRILMRIERRDGRAPWLDAGKKWEAEE